MLDRCDIAGSRTAFEMRCDAGSHLACTSSFLEEVVRRGLYHLVHELPVIDFSIHRFQHQFADLVLRHRHIFVVTLKTDRDKILMKTAIALESTHISGETNIQLRGWKELMQSQSKMYC